MFSIKGGASQIFAEGCQPFIGTNYLKALCKGWQPFRNGAAIWNATTRLPFKKK